MEFDSLLHPESKSKTMEEVNNIKVSIPKPCHEDWNKMTPNQQGAFCKMCAKSVIDFTQKTVQELKQYLLERKEEKICGRVNSSQLDIPKLPGTIALNIPLSLIPRSLSFSNTFAIALFLTFGTTLFSCNTQQGELVGDIATTIDSYQNRDTLVKNKSVTLIDSAKTKKGEIKSGKISEKECTPLKGDIAIEEIKEEMLIKSESMVNGGLTIESDTLEKMPLVGKIKIEKQ